MAAALSVTTTFATTAATSKTSAASAAGSSTTTASAAAATHTGADPFTWSSSLSPGTKAAYAISYILLILLCSAILYFLVRSAIQYRRQPRGTKELFANDPSLAGTVPTHTMRKEKELRDVEEGNQNGEFEREGEIQAVH